MDIFNRQRSVSTKNTDIFAAPRSFENVGSGFGAIVLIAQGLKGSTRQREIKVQIVCLPQRRQEISPPSRVSSLTGCGDHFSPKLMSTQVLHLSSELAPLLSS